MPANPVADEMVNELPSTDQACDKIGRMWLDLGERIAATIPDIVIDSKPELAIQWARCAEVCFWQATGESESFGVKDVIAAVPAKQEV